MIKSKEDLKYYIDCDLKAGLFANGIKDITIAKRIRAVLVPEPWKFQELMRKAEYFTNVGTGFSKKILGTYYRLKARRYGAKCGFSIPINIFGPGLFLPHTGTIVINSHAKFGSNVRIHVGVNIGTFSRFGENHVEYAVPVFGNNIYIGPGAKIYGPVRIGDNVAIGANAVVSKDVPAHCTVVGANKIVNEKGSINLLQYADKSVIPHDSCEYLNQKS